MDSTGSEKFEPLEIPGGKPYNIPTALHFSLIFYLVRGEILPETDIKPLCIPGDTLHGRDPHQPMQELLGVDYLSLQRVVTESFHPFVASIPDPYFALGYIRQWKGRTQTGKEEQVTFTMYILNTAVTRDQLGFDPTSDTQRLTSIRQDDIVIPEGYPPFEPMPIVHIAVGELYFSVKVESVGNRRFLVGYTDGLFLLPIRHWKYTHLVEQGIDVGSLLPIPLTRSDRRMTGIPDISLSDNMLLGVERLVAQLAENQDVTPVAATGYLASRGSRLLARRCGYFPKTFYEHNSIPLPPGFTETATWELAGDHRWVKLL